jgi:hypothetical protein
MTFKVETIEIPGFKKLTIRGELDNLGTPQQIKLRTLTFLKLDSLPLQTQK